MTTAELTRVGRRRARTAPPDRTEPPTPADAPPAAAEQATATLHVHAGRVLALDALRGLVILLMLLVNNLALDTATPTQLAHAPWNGGVRVADLVYPWFLFCVGVAIPFSMAGSRRRGWPAWRVTLRVLSRTAILVLLGCLLDSSLSKRPVLKLGVLQMIGLSYLVGALLYELSAGRRMLVAGALLGLHWMALKLLPIPGVGTGVLAEHDNFVQHLNRTYLEAVHLAGLPSLVPLAALVLIGSVIGDLLRQPRSTAWLQSPRARRQARHPEESEGTADPGTHRIASLLVAGVGLLAAAGLWSLSIGFNRLVWAPSFVLLAAATGTVALALLYVLIDTTGWRSWAYPLLVFGSNAVLAYVAPILVKAFILQEWQVRVGPGQLVPVLQWWLDFWVAHAGRIAGGWLYTLSYLAVWWGVLWHLYRKQLFLRV